jgi:DNA-directed RNA polymerase specialized sigma subunit
MDPAIAEVWSQYWDGAPELKPRLVLQYAPLVKFFAHRVPGDPQATVQRGLESLSAAIETYKPDCGAFESYALGVLGEDAFSWDSGGWAEVG